MVSLLISYLTHSLFMCVWCVLFNFHIFMNILALLRWLISSLISLWLYKILKMIWIFISLMCDLTCNLSSRVLCVCLKKMNILLFLDGMFCIYLFGPFDIMCSASMIFPYWFYVWKWVLKSFTVILLLFISVFRVILICLICLPSTMFSAYMLTVISSQWFHWCSII